MGNYTLGSSFYYHDSAVALLKEEEVAVAVKEDRFSRNKIYFRFSKNAISYCLESQSISISDVMELVCCKKILLPFELLVETYPISAPREWRSFVSVIQAWMKEKLFLKLHL